MKYEHVTITVPGQMEGSADLTAYLLDSISVEPDRRRPAVIVLAGGGYWNLSDREQEPIVMQFLSMGCHAFLLQYSVAPHRFPVSLQELAFAVAEVRDHADQWKIDPDGILVCGFSAGGHLACSLGTFWNNPIAYEAIGKTPQQIRPNGLILGYPVITTGPFCHPRSIEKLLGEKPDSKQLEVVSLERQVTKDMPPVFVWHTVSDMAVPVENSLLLAAALCSQNISCELHLFPSGGHGLALSNRETGGTDSERLEPCCQIWILLVHTWIKNRYL